MFSGQRGVVGESFDVVVAVSGGVDSLYALVLLVDEGLRVAALHACFRGTDAVLVRGLRDNCAALGVPLFVEDCRDAFEDSVVRPFVRAYSEGRTPNPCAVCNRSMKFGLLMDMAFGHGASVMATGHYASLADHPRYGRVIAPAADAAKDQSYFLALVPRERLHSARFPLSGVDKAVVRRTVTARGLSIPAPRESQDICFIEGGDYRTLLADRGLTLQGPGDVELGGRVIARHQGLWRYTEGQRRGLGIAWSEPLYVLSKDVAENRLVVGTRDDVMRRGCRAGEANVLVPPELWPAGTMVRLRYGQKAVPAAVRIEGGGISCTLESPGQRAAPGQVMAVYDEDGILLAGGVITD